MWVVAKTIFRRGDQYIIERSGKPMAALVPVEQYEQWRKEREAFFQLVGEIRQGNRTAKPEKIERDIAACRRAVRARG